MFKIRKKDKVRVISGKDKGKEGEVLKVLPETGKLFIAGVNIALRHLKPREGRKGGIVEVERPLSVSKAAFICKSCQKPVKIGFKTENGKKLRFCKYCQSVL